ncbi:type IV secretion system DNA-binding domain-containing protein [Candidatus Woesebacteria bacterium]|nr:type IV secretion system DNA-binding domain-containing protein [Candidatus Woesebacteria bacterium]
MSELTTLLLKLPRNTDVTPEAAQTFLAPLTKIKSVGFLQSMFGKKPQKLSLEIILKGQEIGFYITASSEIIDFVTSQIQSSYPLSIIEKTKDPVSQNDKPLYIYYLKLKKGNYYPISTYDKFTDIDPLSSLLSILSKGSPENFTVIQYALSASDSSWQASGVSYAETGEKKEDGSYSPRADQSIIKEKIGLPGFRASIRIASTKGEMIKELTNTYTVYERADGNSFYANTPSKFRFKKEIVDLYQRNVADKQILNTKELATLWHLPSEKIKTQSIAWGTNVLSEPPSNLPTAEGKTEEEKKSINFFARTQFKNKEAVFGIKDIDRLRHIWSVGKTGTGKSTMIANMAIDDMKKNRGVAVIDPHGDLCEDLLNFIPSHRINETIYFNPADKDFPINLNPLEVTNREEAELVVSGLMAIFTKVWANVWSARMEYILRNSFMTLTEIPGSTLEDVLKILSNQEYRTKILKQVKDAALQHYWKEEFEKMPEKLQKEAIAPIQNKVGQFVTSPMIRRIIGNPTSSVSLDDVMDDSKILLANLSQGRLGEDNAALLGAMLITKFQISAMHRVDVEKDKRVPFYLYVDEFQNFATDSFIKILSEARKFGLSIMMANQYMAQIPENVQKAILGNAGTIITFAAGADDAAILHREFAEVFSQNDLVNLKRFQIAIKLMIDAHSSRPFLANTLPLPDSSNQNREKVIKVSRERWTKAFDRE